MRIMGGFEKQRWAKGRSTQHSTKLSCIRAMACVGRYGVACLVGIMNADSTQQQYLL